MPDCYDTYWIEAVSESFSEHGISATDEQIEQVAGDISVSHENFGMAFGHDVASHNMSAEKDRTIEQLRKELEDERRKRVCPECRGKGYVVENCAGRSSTMECHVCRGAGRL